MTKSFKPSPTTRHDMHRSNCLFFALRLWLRRKRVGSITIRGSYYGRFPHFLYQEHRHVIHYVPLDPRHKTCPPPLFKGRVKWGDVSVGSSKFGDLT